MLDLSYTLIHEKNSMSGNGNWLTLLEIQLPDTSTIRLVRNTEDITWNGKVWIAFPFTVDDVKESKNELPEINLRVSNVTRYLQPYLEDYQGCVGATVILRIIHSLALNETTPGLEENFTIISTSTDASFVTFKLGGNFPSTSRFPLDRYLKNFCVFPFKGLSCGYNGSASSCDKTLTKCKELGNSARFGGFPGIPMGGLYK